MSADAALAPLRAQLDAIDEHLLVLLRERLDCCVAIAEVKRRIGVPMMQPHRIESVMQRAVRFGAEHDISSEFLCRLFTLIIDETCRVEDIVIARATDADARPDKEQECEPC